MAKYSLRWSRLSGSARQKINRIVQQGDRATKRALSSNRRRQMAERLDYGR